MIIWFHHAPYRATPYHTAPESRDIPLLIDEIFLTFANTLPSPNKTPIDTEGGQSEERQHLKEQATPQSSQ